MKKLYEKICNNEEVRQSLSKLRQELKIEENKEKLLKLLDRKYETFTQLLTNEDAKTRKNVALLMGDLACKEFLEPLYEAYCREEQLFIRSSYLQAIKQLDYRPYLDKFKEKVTELSQIVLDESNKKHIMEELRALSDLVVTMEGVKMHTFTGYHEPSELMILTNRRHMDVTLEQLKQIVRLDTSKAKCMNAGIRIPADCLDKILPIRTYQDILFLVRGMKACEMNPEAAAGTIVESGLLDFMTARHGGKAPFYFRVELKTKMELDRKSAFTKKLSAEIERLSNRTFINTTSQYEFEIRLIENKEGNCNVMVKLYTIGDERFSYRKELIPTSIKPVNAALLVALAKDYMIEDARVLDPFCGVGTMLLERQKQIPANTSYGIDMNPAAIEKARVNTEAAGQIIHYINRNYFDFTHEYLFDEIFTNMPFAIGHKTEDEIYDIYVNFFDRSREHLEKEGTIIMYTHNKEYVRKLAKECGYRIIKEMEINVREGTWLYIIKQNL
ncbi:MAG: methyltransferase [Lachnospiraceae bacterium]|nr:methyltransferase [Lachnospiraceae bacterium]